MHVKAKNRCKSLELDVLWRSNPGATRRGLVGKPGATRNRLGRKPETTRSRPGGVSKLEISKKSFGKICVSCLVCPGRA